MVRERTRAGLVAARDRGAKLGRPAKLSLHQQQEVLRAVRDGPADRQRADHVPVGTGEGQRLAARPHREGHGSQRTPGLMR